MDDFAKDIETLQSFVGQPYNNTDQQDAEIRLFTELMAMLAQLTKPTITVDAEPPATKSELFSIEKGLDKLHKVIVGIQDKSAAKKEKMEALVKKVEKVTNDHMVIMRKIKGVESMIKDAVEKEVRKVFETE